MKRFNRLNNVPIILIAILVLLLILAALTVLFGPGGSLLGTASNLPTPEGERSPVPAATRDRPTAQASSTPVQPTDLPPPTSTASPPPGEPSPTGEPSLEPSPTGDPPTFTPVPASSVRPVVECVTANGDGTYTAYFGYRNDGDEAVTIPLGPRNRVAPAPEDRGQPATFGPGATAPWPNAPFSVIFSGSLSWRVEGHAATASPDSPRCTYRVQIEVRWYDTEGNSLAGPPEALPPEFAITAQSQIGAATCTYGDGSSLVCQYDNQSGGGGALLVPAGGSYTTSESGLPAGWQPFSGVGVFPASGSSQSLRHVIDNRAAGAPAPSPTPSPTATSGSSDLGGATPTSAPAEPAAPTEPPAEPRSSTVTPAPTEPPATVETPAATPPPSEMPLASPETSTPAAIAQTTPSPSATGTAEPLLPATGDRGHVPLLTVGILALGLALALRGVWVIRRHRPG